jgi:drug/metabolite transporter (DMT)-like permease
VLACALYGANVNFLKFKVEGLGSMTVTSVSLLLIGPFAFVYLFGFTDFTQKLISQEGAWQAAGFIVILALMSTAIANLIFNKMLQISSPLFAASVTYLIPVVSVMWGVLDGEKLYVGHFIGMVAILGGVYLANRK